MIKHLGTFLTGLAMGAANVIPGVSGGTIALITGIYERLILALKKIDLESIQILLRGNIKAVWVRVDATFLFWLLLGVGVSIFSLARLFEWLLVNHETLTMSAFFGLILASIFYVARDVAKWNVSSGAFLVVGTAIAVAIATLAPASENPNPLYLFFCGVIAISSMILPGLSGSFVLILLGNYTLVLGAINDLDLMVLIPLAAGCGVGLLAFAQILGWVFKRYRDATLATMTGFVLGSLVTIWPWKEPIIRVVELEDEKREVVTGYTWLFPQLTETQTWLAIAIAVLGALALVGMELAAAGKRPASPETGER